MGKINYTKAEEAIYHSLFQKHVYEMLEDATLANLILGVATVSKSKEEEYLSEEEIRKLQKTKIGKDKIIANLIAKINFQLKKLKEAHPESCSEFGFTEEDDLLLSSEPEKLSQEDWLRIKSIKDMLSQPAVQALSSLPSKSSSDQDLSQVETQQKAHVHKKYNVKHGWVPL